MQRKIVLHIGIHRTGSTSLQEFLHNNPDLVAQAGYAYPTGRYAAYNHTELVFATLRDGRGTFARDFFKPPQRAEVARQVRAWLADVFAANPDKSLVFSHEGLSYLRFADEVMALKALFGELDVGIVLYLRERQSLLASYRRFMAAHKVPPSSDPASHRYVEPDTWLLDYDAIVRAYAAVFGLENMTILAYEAEKARYGGTVRSFFRTLGVDLVLASEPAIRSDE